MKYVYVVEYSPYHEPRPEVVCSSEDLAKAWVAKKMKERKETVKEDWRRGVLMYRWQEKNGPNKGSNVGAYLIDKIEFIEE